MNNRVFVLNDPVNLVDPEGLFAATTVAIVRFVVIPLAVRYGPPAYRAAQSAYLQYAPHVIDFAEGFLMPTSPPPTPGGFAGYSARQYLFDPLIDKLEDLPDDKPAQPCP